MANRKWQMVKSSSKLLFEIIHPRNRSRIYSIKHRQVEVNKGTKSNDFKNLLKFFVASKFVSRITNIVFCNNFFGNRISFDISSEYLSDSKKIMCQNFFASA